VTSTVVTSSHMATSWPPHDRPLKKDCPPAGEEPGRHHGTETGAECSEPTEQVEEGVLRSLLALYSRHDLIDKAVAAYAQTTDGRREQHQNELAWVDAGAGSATPVVDNDGCAPSLARWRTKAWYAVLWQPPCLVHGPGAWRSQ
jgi:hypothetical protein